MNHVRAGIGARAAALALVSLLLLPAAAAAFDFTDPPAAGPITATLPLLGASLKVDVATDGAGNLTSVALDPVGDFTATRDRPHAVKFENADGSVKVTISSWGGGTSIKARAGTLAALEGEGSWKADVFSTGHPTTVQYTVGDNGSGGPTIVVDSVSTPGAPAGFTATAGTPTTKTKGDFTTASVGVQFAWNGFKRHLAISVTAGTGDDAKASLKVSLGGRSGQSLSGTLADVLGSHTWHGQLCDGTSVGIAFQVVGDGSGGAKVTYDPDTFATGAPAHAWNLKHGSGFVALFDQKHAAVLVWLRHKSDGSWKLSVGSFVGRWCKGTTIPNPTVNTPVAPDATKGPDGKWHWNFWGWGWDRHHGGHGCTKSGGNGGH